MLEMGELSVNALIDSYANIVHHLTLDQSNCIKIPDTNVPHHLGSQVQEGVQVEEAKLCVE